MDIFRGFSVEFKSMQKELPRVILSFSFFYSYSVETGFPAKNWVEDLFLSSSSKNSFLEVLVWRRLSREYLEGTGF